MEIYQGRAEVQNVEATGLIEPTQKLYFQFYIYNPGQLKSCNT